MTLVGETTLNLLLALSLRAIRPILCLSLFIWMKEIYAESQRRLASIYTPVQ